MVDYQKLYSDIILSIASLVLFTSYQTNRPAKLELGNLFDNKLYLDI
jgi:hypothetical protein